MSTNESSNDIAVKYLGRTLYLIVISIIIYALACKSYNTYIAISQEKIEVQATNSNFTKLNNVE